MKNQIFWFGGGEERGHFITEVRKYLKKVGKKYEIPFSLFGSRGENENTRTSVENFLIPRKIKLIRSVLKIIRLFFASM